DVRRMLLTQKAFAEGGRMLMGYCYKLVEVIEAGNDEDAATRADQALAFLTPIAKAFLTETGCECANLAVQCYGGHGFIKENGVEQLVRDSKIATLYEGTTGVQALDLLGRKVLMSQGEAMKPFVSEIQAFCSEHSDSPFAAKLLEMIQQWGDLTMKIGVAAMENPDELGAASVDYLMFSGYITLAYFWAQAAQTAQQTLDNGTGEAEFYTAKIQTARFYFSRLLPRTNTLAETMLAGAEDLMSMDEEAFAF
ncbi:MAG: acyl-CoA dehydrogenase C-terminal domain-containing protein, partial [Pseudomonadota bacterium]|nr:acyl-CoA dehydrogenase C-terminal domain-containing protein [Pseudomonadota bacterium]